MKFNSKTMSAVMGTAFLATVSQAPVANAAENPFASSVLSSGYKVAAEGKCGEGSCGSTGRYSSEEANYGDLPEGVECHKNKCYYENGKVYDPRYAGTKRKASSEGKCGEGKCGS